MKYSSHWLEDCLNTINMHHTQTYYSQAENVLLTVELTTHLKQDKKKWRVIFHTCIKLFQLTPVYVCICYTYLCIYIHIYNALGNSGKSATGGVLGEIFNKNPDLKLEFCSLQLYRKLTLTYFRDKKQLSILVLHIC